jgi:hypothetical protein
MNLDDGYGGVLRMTVMTMRRLLNRTRTTVKRRSTKRTMTASSRRPLKSRRRPIKVIKRRSIMD